ncbi:coenzyme Q-binding protein COQ10 homolog, mitochondrial [Entelurus aequoreus]|uniref:coenzyme Q-binding protein COQ10 homolog, mitochondrial n=1 Tax=Entelurus aequoreus TaxID=161455 RepID=UPI002B1D0C50|nr:coenzyme Q-binding protein COQ10 homolog, mitochondrial [Entelurus aequoreus]
MTVKSTPRIARSLLAGFQVHSKFVRGNVKAGNARRVGPGGVLGTWSKTTSSQCASYHINTPRRSFINLAAGIGSRRTEYTENRTLGYTPEQMFRVVSSVEKYQHFVPWCKKSRLVKGTTGGDVRVELEIGFPPVLERYTSEVTVVPNHQVRALCTDGSLFSHLETVWRFAPEPKDSCKVDFYVSFEFKSLLHAHLASVFFDEVVKQMVSAFESRAAVLYGRRREVPPRRGSR